MAKKEVKKNEKKPRSGPVTSDDVKAQAKEIAEVSKRFSTLATFMESKGVKVVNVDGIQKFGRAVSLLEEHLVSLDYFIGTQVIRQK